MFRSVRSAAVDVSAELQQLPTSHVSFQLEGAWFVLGPTGLFVVVADEGDMIEAADRATTRASELRLQLALDVDWVPFVDALVATHRDDAYRTLPCIAVPTDLLRYTLTEGPRAVDEETLARLIRARLSHQH